ncbi:MAG TPA: retroviral-like aspartic protease family protein [Gemmatimonadales bacterium]|jgi:clan AA aspartic protease|nr:retroviral-like aspartic protease family protein [Gemmatimonadales bacterium]
MKRFVYPGRSTASSTMSHFWVSIHVGSHELQALVDTGSTYTWVARDVLDAAGVVPRDERPFVLADGREVSLPVGWTSIRLDDREQPTVVVFAPLGTETILGVVTLEEFGLAADPVNERLIRVPSRAKRAA